MRRAVALGVVAVAAAHALADEATPIDRLVGREIGDFELRDVRTDETVTLGIVFPKGNGSWLPTWLGGRVPASAAAFVFVTPGCPLGERYVPTLGELARDYRHRGVQLYGIASNAGTTANEVREWATGHELGFPVLHDPGNVVADALMVERSNEVVLVDAKRVIRYRGAIDDQYGYETALPEPRNRFLADAIESLLAGRDARERATSVAGCRLTKVAAKKSPLDSLERVRPVAVEIARRLDATEDAPPLPDSVDYATHVAPIIEARCQSCHRPGQAGGFSLLTYADALERSAMIAEVVENRRMPPWHADPQHGTFANDARLPPLERATILKWVADGAPEGEQQRPRRPRVWNDDGWQLGQPDAVFELPEENVIPAQGVIPYWFSTVDTGFAEDRWIQAVEARAGNPAVVHHFTVYLQAEGKATGARPTEAAPYLGTYVPGEGVLRYPAGTAMRLPAGSRIMFMMHYSPNGKVARDRSKVGLMFAKEPPLREALMIPVLNTKFVIPPGASDFSVHASHRFTRDVRLLEMKPHMHLRGKTALFTLTLPGSPPEVMLSVPAYDFGWQERYVLAQPRLIPAGATMAFDATFDNSAANPANPDPTREVRWGQQSFEEMMVGSLMVDVPVGTAPAAASR